MITMHGLPKSDIDILGDTVLPPRSMAPPPGTKMLMWTIYQKPKDFPNDYVMHATAISDEEPRIRSSRIAWVGPLEELRAIVPPGLKRLERTEDDHPSFLEAWT